jgi:2-polyprenyl-3-methyl-5-hydroxy-6-metoxy-1,4-benzoquinol methylase
LGSYYESEEYISHSNAKKGFVNTLYQSVRNYTIGKKVKLIRQFQPDGDFLDIGCGTGEFLYALSKAGYRVKGIEPNKNAREFCRNNYELDVLDEKILDSFEENSFDAISMWHVLEHVYSLKERVGRLKKILRPDGTLFIAVPNPESYDAKKYGKYWAAWDVPRHLYHFRQQDIETLFKQFDFSVIKTIPMNFDSYYVSLLSEKYKNGRQRIIPAFVNGFLSNVSAWVHNKNYSSLIYILKPKFD